MDDGSSRVETWMFLAATPPRGALSLCNFRFGQAKGKLATTQRKEDQKTLE